MTVIAWDGSCIAADRLAVNNGLKSITTKLQKFSDSRYGEVILGVTGNWSVGWSMARWYRLGAKPDTFPYDQVKENEACLIVAHTAGCFFYENTPEEIYVEQDYFAWGAGRDFAMAAMYFGKGAIQGIVAASELDVSCGLGVTAFERKADDNDINILYWKSVT